jgi:transposase-like protein
VKHVRAWRRSGQSSRAYAARAGLNANTLLYWSWQLRREGAKPDESPAPRAFDFVELPSSVSSSDRASPAIELETGRVLLRVSDGFDAETLRRVLDVVEGRP